MSGWLGAGTWLLIGWPGGSWQATVKVVLAAVITYLLVLWVLMVWWTYRDIRARTRDPFLQAAAVFVVLVFNLPGLWMYLIGRPRETLAEAYVRTLEEEALLQELEDLKACPACHRRVADDFIICPVCQTQLKEPCAACSRPLSYSWAACPYCARPRRAFQPGTTATPAIPVAADQATTQRRAPRGGLRMAAPPTAPLPESEAADPA